MRKIRERDVVSYLIRRVRATGGIVRKVTWQGHRGAPDLLVSWPACKGGGFPILVEVKKPGMPLQAHQEYEIDLLRNAGVGVMVVDSFEAVDAMLAWGEL